MRDGHKKDEILILVDENDRPLGYQKREEAHKGNGIRHRGYTVAVFNPKGELLLARRHPQKLFGGLWDGTVSSHPLKGEDYKKSILREVEEEIGVPNAKVERVGEIVYQSSDGDGMAENEFCALFKMTTDREIVAGPEEVSETKWVSPEDLKKDVKEHPEKYAPWFLLSLPQVLPE